MKTKLHSSFAIRHSLSVLVAAFTLFALPFPAPAQTNATISAADFQRLVYCAHLHTKLVRQPELEACLRVFLELQHANPQADPLSLVGVLTNALQLYRTSAPHYIRNGGCPDEVLAAYLEALRQVPVSTNFPSASPNLLKFFLLGAADYQDHPNCTPLDLINAVGQRMSSSHSEAIKRQALVDKCMTLAQSNALFGVALDRLLAADMQVSLGDTPAAIIGNPNSPLRYSPTMKKLLVLSEAAGNGPLTVSRDQLAGLFTSEMQTMWDTIHTNLAVFAQVNQSQADPLAYLTNQAAIDAHVQLQTPLLQDQPDKLASATTAILIQSELDPGNQNMQQAWAIANTACDFAKGVGLLTLKKPEGIEPLLSGFLDAFNLFTGGSPEDQTARELKNIKTLIHDLSSNMNYRFDRVDQSLTTIFDMMNQQFNHIDIRFDNEGRQIAQLNTSVNDVRSSLAGVQTGLDRLESEVFQDFDNLQKTPIHGPINEYLLYQIRHPNNGPISYEEYRATESAFYEYATAEAQNAISCPSFTGHLPPPNSRLVNAPLCANLNYLQGFLNQGLLQPTAGSPPLANPKDWFISAYASLQLAGENPEYFQKYGTSDLSDIIGRGQNLATFCGSLSFTNLNLHLARTNNFNWPLYGALENYYLTNLNSFNAQIAAIEGRHASIVHFAVGHWRKWDEATLRISAADTAISLAVSSNDLHNLALKIDGTVVGQNLGNAEPHSVRSSIAFPSIRNRIAAGSIHSLALKGDGTVTGWGGNNNSQINVPAGLTNLVAVAAGGNHNLALKVDGTVAAWGDNGYGLNDIPVGLSNVMAIAAGGYHSLALKANGTIVVWGAGRINNPRDFRFIDDGQSIIPAGLSNVVAIAAGGYHSLALKADGTVVAWGGGLMNTPDPKHFHIGCGQSIIPAGLSNVVAIAAGGLHSLALKADGTVVAWGAGLSYNPGDYVDYNQSIVPAGLSNVVAIAAGSYHSLALQTDGTVVAWGAGSVNQPGRFVYNYGQSIVPSGLSNVVAVAAGGAHSLALQADGTVVGWGAGSPGMSGDPNYRQATVPTSLVDLAAWTRITSPSSPKRVERQGKGTVFLGPELCFAQELEKRLCEIPAVGNPITAVVSGSAHCLAITADRSVVAWGLNTWGQTNVPSQARHGVRAVAGGLGHSLALLTNDCVVAWGLDDFGQSKVPESAQTGIIAISAGGKHNLALKSDGTVVGWGLNGSLQAKVPAEIPGQTVQGQVVAIAAGGEHSLALKADGTVVGWGNNDDGQATGVPAHGSAPGVVVLKKHALSDVVAIAAGRYHSLALKSDGSVVAWGLSSSGQCNVPESAQSGVVAIAAGLDQSLALKADGSAVVWGSDSAVLPTLEGRNKIVACAAGDRHYLTLTARTASGTEISQALILIPAPIPARVISLLQSCNQNTIDELSLSGSALNKAAAGLLGARLLLADVLELAMPYTLQRDDVLHGSLYGSKPLVDASVAIDFLRAQNAHLGTGVHPPPHALVEMDVLPFLCFQDRLNQCLTNLQATGQPQIPRLIGHTLRLLDLLKATYSPPINSVPSGLELRSATNSPTLFRQR